MNVHPSCGLSLESIRLAKKDFGPACQISEFIYLKHVATDHVLVETNRYSRRELTRNGISFSYPDQKIRLS